MKAYETILKVTMLSMLALLLVAIITVQAEAQVRALHIPSSSLDIQTSCKNDRAIFKIRNDGGRWVALGEFVVVSENDRKIVSRRKMRMAADQVITYRVPMMQSAAGDTVHLVLLSEASRTRPLAKAKLSCGAQ